MKPTPVHYDLPSLFNTTKFKKRSN